METLTSHTADFQLVSNLILVEAELNGRIKTLVFDTGASHTVVERNVANDLGLAKTDQTEPTKGCMAFGEAQMTELKSRRAAARRCHRACHSWYETCRW